VERERKWKLRERQFAIGRMYHANLISGEQFYYQLLLTVVLSPKSYEDLRTVNGTVYNSFLGACVALGLLEDDQE
jgi:FtsZ-interacting cell division protein YlmF